MKKKDILWRSKQLERIVMTLSSNPLKVEDTFEEESLTQ